MEGSWRRRGSDDRPEERRSRPPEFQALPSLEPRRKLLTANKTRINLVEPAGFWSVSVDYATRGLDGLTELDRVWLAAKEVVHEGYFVQASCYTPGSDIVQDNDREYSTLLIHCYVDNYLEIDRVVVSADELRKKVHYPYVMYLKTNRVRGENRGSETLLKYIYCVDGNIYENTDFGFKLVRFSTEIR